MQYNTCYVLLHTQRGQQSTSIIVTVTILTRLLRGWASDQ